MQEFNFTVDNKNHDQRIDKYLSLNMENISRSYIHKLIESSNITVNQKNINKNYKISENDNIRIFLPDPQPLNVVPENISLDIFYEDNDLLIINKAKNMVVHPAPGNYSGTLVNALLYHCKDSLSGINGILRPGIVHRIDKDTSGLLIVAKNDYAHKILAAQIKEHSFVREYEAVVFGKLKNEESTIRTNIGRSSKDRKKMSVVSYGGKIAVTHYKLIKQYNKFAHIKLRLETGRTHQIRTHMAYIGHAVIGDEIYANSKNNPFKFLKGQCLHARTIGFIHPSTQKYMEFISPLPAYFQETLKKISNL